MKKLFTLSMLLSTLLLAQLPNASFENWTAGEPDGWYTPNSSGTVVVSAATPAQHGNFALKGEVATIQGFIIPPVVILGTDGEGIPNTIRYTRLSGYYKYTQAGSDLFTTRIVLTKTGDITVGAGSLQLPPAANYTAFNVDVTYATNDTPDTLVITFEIGGVGGFGTVGSSYVIDNLSLSTSTSNDDQTIGVNNFSLKQNYPNPFNPSTVISYQLSASSNVVLKIFDVLGNEVATIVNEMKEPGVYQVEFPGVETGHTSASFSNHATSLPSGVYYYQLRAGDFVETKKMILMR